MDYTNFDFEGFKPRQKRVLQALMRTLGNAAQALLLTEIPPRTFYNWKRDNPDFALACKCIEDEAIDFGEQQLFKLMEKGNSKATIYFLKTRGRGRGYF